MKIWLNIIIVAFLNLGCTASVLAENNKLTGVYTNLEYSSESGDVIGMEVFLVYSKKGYYAIFQDSEGEPSIPVVISAKIDSKNITFIIPRNSGTSYSGEFKGRFTERGLVGAFKGIKQKIILERRNSYWQKKGVKSVY